MKSVVSTKGQVTLPAEVRAKLGLTVGTAVLLDVLGADFGVGAPSLPRLARRL